MRQRISRKGRDYYVIYCAINMINNKSYVGQTCQFKKRQQNHFKKSEAFGHKAPFHAAIQSYGKENFKWMIIEEVSSLQEANEAEEFYISYLETLYPNGYNLLPGGNNRRLSAEIKERIREKLKIVGNLVGKKGKDHPNFGKKHTEEWKKQQSESKSGEKSPNVKLTKEQVIAIYEMGLSGNHASSVSKLFNCGHNTVLNIYHRKSWKALLANFPPIDFNLLKRGDLLKQSKLTASLVIQILNDATKLPGSLYQRSKLLAKKYNISTTQIYHILLGKVWKHIDRSIFSL